MDAELQQRQLLAAVDGVLLDLGVSSPQLDDAQRGFSFMHDGPLDMRMNPNAGISAAQWLAQVSAEEMARVFKEYGEERFAKRMANPVVARRQLQPLPVWRSLAAVLTEADPAWEKGKHPATRAFQGMRIHLNNELADLEQGLVAALASLKVGGTLGSDQLSLVRRPYC